MALFTFKLPDIGEGISAAEIVGWHVAVGDRVEEDQPVADMMTDKATVEMESPVAGIVTRLAGEPGDQVPIGAMLVEIETEEAATAPSPVSEPVAADGPGDSDRDMKGAEPPVPPRSAAPVGADGHAKAEIVQPASPEAAPVAAEPKAAPLLASPAVRARARDLGIDLAQVKASGDHVRHVH